MGAGLSRSSARNLLLGLCAAGLLRSYLRARAGRKRLTASSTEGSRGTTTAVNAVRPPRPTRPTPGAPDDMPPRPARATPRDDLPAPPARAPPGAPSATNIAPRPPCQAAIDTDLWICVDFEWTCDEGENRQVHPEEGEIIEFAFVVFDSRAGRMACEGQYYIKPQRTPVTEFCTELTGITKEKLENAGSLQDALCAFEKAMAAAGAASKSCCAVAHGSADLELMLPCNCKASGLEVPPCLRRYVDLREAAQTYVASTRVRGKRASTLRQICEALNVQMLGDEHCGLDDSWMVLLCTQELLKMGADLCPVDLDLELKAGLGSTGREHSLCLDGLPFFAIVSEVKPWVEMLSGSSLSNDAVWVVLGLDGRPSGRGVVDFESRDAAMSALKAAANGGRRMICGSVDLWPFEGSKERLILVRPLRQKELILQRQRNLEDVVGPVLVPFPTDPQALTRSGKGKGKGGNGAKLVPENGCTGRIKMFNTDKGFGFIAYPAGEVFVHCNDCGSGFELVEGALVCFDVVEDTRRGKTRAVNVRAHAA